MIVASFGVVSGVKRCLQFWNDWKTSVDRLRSLCKVLRLNID